MTANDHSSLVQHIRNLAFRAFGEDEAERWLTTHSRFFNGRTPLDMLWSHEDAQRVMDFIRQLMGAEDQMRLAAIPHRDR